MMFIIFYNLLLMYFLCSTNGKEVEGKGYCAIKVYNIGSFVNMS